MPKNHCEIYYFGSMEGDKYSSIKTHQHPFWQMEILLKGEFAFTFEKKTTKVVAPAIILIPPNIDHKFNYGLNYVKLISIKFQETTKLLSPKTIIQPTQAPINYIVKAIEHEFIKSTNSNKDLLENLTHALWSHYYHHTEQKSQNNLNDKIKQLIETKKGIKLTIHEIAEHFFLSDSYISSYFRKNNTISLKEFIDQRRVYFAKTLLLYSEFNISEIAHELEFKDLYSFSHFFKRKTKQTPSAFKSKGEAI